MVETRAGFAANDGSGSPDPSANEQQQPSASSPVPPQLPPQAAARGSSPVPGPSGTQSTNAAGPSGASRQQSGRTDPPGSGSGPFPGGSSGASSAGTVPPRTVPPRSGGAFGTPAGNNPNSSVPGFNNGSSGSGGPSGGDPLGRTRQSPAFQPSMGASGAQNPYGAAPKTTPIPTPRMSRFTKDGRFEGDWSDEDLQNYYDRFTVMLEDIIDRPISALPAQIKLTISYLKTAIDRLGTVYQSGRVDSDPILHMELMRNAITKMAEYQQFVSRDLAAGGANDYVAGVASGIPGARSAAGVLQTDVPINWDVRIPYDAAMIGYANRVMSGQVKTFSSEHGTSSWGDWWEYWYGRVHRYPDEVIGQQERLTLLIKSLRDPAKQNVLGDDPVAAVTGGNATFHYKRLMISLHTSYNLETVDLTKLVSNLQKQEPQGESLEEFRSFMGNMDSAIAACIVAGCPEDYVYRTALQTAKEKIEPANYREWRNMVAHKGIEYPSVEAEYGGLRQFVNSTIRERTKRILITKHRASWDGPLAKKQKTASEEKPSPKPRNSGGGHGGGKGKGADDTPGWKDPPEANLQSFQQNDKNNWKKGGGRGGGRGGGQGGGRGGGRGNRPRNDGERPDDRVGTKEFRMQDLCGLHGKKVTHAPMECNMKLDHRKDAVKKLRLCYNCLGKGHMANACFAMKACDECHKAHHPSLCAKNPHVRNAAGNGGKGGPSGAQGDKKFVRFQTPPPESDTEDSDAKHNAKSGMSVPSKRTSHPSNGANTSRKSNSQ